MEKSKIKFHSVLKEFLHKYSVENAAFIDYFKTYYCNRVKVWSTACSRNVPLEITNTNMYSESFHSKLKTLFTDITEYFVKYLGYLEKFTTWVSGVIGYK